MAIALQQFAGTENGTDREVVFLSRTDSDIAKPAQSLLMSTDGCWPS